MSIRNGCKGCVFVELDVLGRSMLAWSFGTGGIAMLDLPVLSACPRSNISERSFPQKASLFCFV